MSYRQQVDPSKAGSSAFYKGVLEWLVCEIVAKREAQRATTDIRRTLVRVKYSDLLREPERVAEKLVEAGCSHYRLDPELAR